VHLYNYKKWAFVNHKNTMAFVGQKKYLTSPDIPGKSPNVTSHHFPCVACAKHSSHWSVQVLAAGHPWSCPGAT
jgi:hypothetical protein